uniref:Uncharacterized protein n=1 Tax=Lygus hesperus TaxID=30085 RepID=A0A146LKE2_LYGHE
MLSHLAIGDLPPILASCHLSLIQLIRQSGTGDVGLHWVPSHRRVLGNCTENRLCALTIAHGTVTNEAYSVHTDLAPWFTEQQQSKWQADYNNTEGPGSWSRRLYNNPNLAPWFHNRPDFSVGEFY